MKEKTMRRILMMLTLLAAPMLLSAQSIIKGVVKDDAGEPVIGATVREVGTSNGTVTDFDGKFELKNITKGEIQISFVGFLTQKVSVKGKSFLEIKMENDQKLLDEVVVVGYGTMRKSDVTGAVSRANIQAFEKSPNTNLLQSLQGTVPGLNVGQASSAGSSPELSIRGANTISGNTSVLIILDGIIFTGNLSSINPADIESVDVLKDASATAVYGAQAANGVLLITSKKGAKGKAKVSFSSSYSFQTPTKKMHTMNRSEMLNFDNECLWQYSKTAESGFTQQKLCAVSRAVGSQSGSIAALQQGVTC
jgi:TonB-dependent SusC/RagA subfamily outer membrane receptor